MVNKFKKLFDENRIYSYFINIGSIDNSYILGEIASKNEMYTCCHQKEILQ